MGDCKSSQFLRHLRSLTPDVSDDFLHSIWSNRLPPNAQAILAGQPMGDLYAMAHCTDRVIKAAPQPTLMSVAPLHEGYALLNHIKELSRSAQRRGGAPSRQLQGSPPLRQQILLLR